MLGNLGEKFELLTNIIRVSQIDDVLAELLNLEDGAVFLGDRLLLGPSLHHSLSPVRSVTASNDPQ